MKVHKQCKACYFNHEDRYCLHDVFYHSDTMYSMVMDSSQLHCADQHQRGHFKPTKEFLYRLAILKNQEPIMKRVADRIYKSRRLNLFRRMFNLFK